MFLLHPIKSLKAILNAFELRLTYIEGQQLRLQTRLESVQEALARTEARQIAQQDSRDIRDSEFRCFSQFGEDGIIQFLLRHVEIDNEFFVEFGVEDYSEANTRFLLMNNNWSGLVLDSSAENIAKITNNRNYYWKYDLRAVQAFITKDNINSILAENGVRGEIGLLSIDIDGNDYWVWDAINIINPVIVIIEYNHRFGPDLAVTVPYDETFDRWTSGRPVVYFGASLKALCLLAERKGYAFVGCNSNGVNAFFVRKDKKSPELRQLSPTDGFVSGKFSELRDENGVVIKSDHEEERRMILSLPLTNVEDTH
jgi:hypothetical protein